MPLFLSHHDTPWEWLRAHRVLGGLAQELQLHRHFLYPLGDHGDSCNHCQYHSHGHYLQHRVFEETGRIFFFLSQLQSYKRKPYGPAVAVYELRICMFAQLWIYFTILYGLKKKIIKGRHFMCQTLPPFLTPSPPKKIKK